MAETENAQKPIAHVSKDGRFYLIQDLLEEVDRMASRFVKAFDLSNPAKKILLLLSIRLTINPEG